MLIVVLVCVVFVLIVLIGFLWLCCDDMEVFVFMLLVFGIVFWSGVCFMEVVSFEMFVCVGWVKVVYFGIMMVLVVWLCMVVGFIWLEFNVLLLVCVGWVLMLFVGVGFVGLVVINELYYLVWFDVCFVVIDGIWGVVFEYGCMFWVVIVYNYVLLVISLVLLVLFIDEVVFGLYVLLCMQVWLVFVIG